jgi:hypothetical protein
MAGTSEGGKKAHRTLLKKRGRNYISQRNSRAGSKSKGGAFTDPSFASEAAKKSWENRPHKATQ